MFQQKSTYMVSFEEIVVYPMQMDYLWFFDEKREKAMRELEKVEERLKAAKIVLGERFNLLEKLKRSGKFIVGYAGAHGIANSLQHLIKAAAILKEHHNIHFLLVGQGPEKQSLQLLAETEEIRNISFLPPVSKTCIPRLLAYIDVAYIGLKHESLFRFGVSPNKLLDYMMAARPVIHAVAAGNDLVAESGCGISVPPENPQAIADAILCLFKMSPQERVTVGQKGQKYVKTHYDYSRLAKKFLESL